MLKFFKNTFFSLFGKNSSTLTINELESLFYEADFGQELTQKLLTHLKKTSAINNDSVLLEIQNFLLKILEPFPTFSLKTTFPYIIMLCGTNGSGKTTSTAKLIHFLQEQGQKLVVGNTDTFRAGAQEQLKIWQERVNFDLIKGQPGGDPASVAFDTVKAGMARNADTIILDTSGRQANNSGLLRELEKIVTVSKKAASLSAIEAWLVIDSTLGQAAYEQALGFNNHVPLTGLIFTKTDGTAKGGILFKIVDKLKIPPLFLGCGEALTDLKIFEATSFCKGLISL